MIRLFLSAMIPAAVAALPGLSRLTPILIDSAENCRFNLGPRQYDLCPILDGTAAQSLLAKGEGKGAYLFQFGLEDTDSGSSRDAGSHCPPGTRVCLIPGKPSESDLPTAISDGSSAFTVYPGESDDFITLQFPAGSLGATARVRLICDSRADVFEPVYSRVKGTLHMFSWRTKYGCGSEELITHSILHTLDSEMEETPADDTSEPSEPEEQLLDGDRERTSRRSAAVVLFVISFAIISLSIISYRHPSRLNLLLTQYVKPIFQRLSLNSFPRISIPHSLKPAGEGRMMRWAHEDLELDEDFMVNGSDALDEPDEAGDEQIPLRPSPRKGGVKNYGSATSPFW